MDGSEQLARDSLRASAEVSRRLPGPAIEPCIRLHADDRELLRSEMKAAVAEGLREAMTKEAAKDFWNVGVEVLQEQATVQTGRFILSGLKTVGKRVLWLTIFLTAMYTLGGWQWFVTTFKVVASSKAGS